MQLGVMAPTNKRRGQRVDLRFGGLISGFYQSNSGKSIMISVWGTNLVIYLKKKAQNATVFLLHHKV